MNGFSPKQDSPPLYSRDQTNKSSQRMFDRNHEPLFPLNKDFLTNQRQLRLCSTKEEMLSQPEIHPTGRLFESPSSSKKLPLIISRSSPRKNLSPSKVSDTSFDVPATPLLLPTVKTNLIYSNNRQVKIIPENQYLTQDQLEYFYLVKPKLMDQVYRECEVEHKLEQVYPGDQNDLTTCSQSEIRIFDEIKSKSQKYKQELKLKTSGPHINIKHIRPSSVFFNSNFESGNLFEVERVSEFEYNLHLSPDFNTPIYTQWYFFAVMNISKGTKVRFNIMNFYKDDSSYSNGMKPFVYSMKKNRENESNLWERGCEDITYQKNSLRVKDRESAPDYEYDDHNIHYYIYEDDDAQSVTLNTLSFSYTFEHDSDYVFFSHFQPYTHSDLQDYLFHLNRNLPLDFKTSQFKVEELCKTIDDQPCHLVTVTDQVNETNSNKQVVFLTSRVHPGESNASFMMQGVLEFLLNPDSKEAQQLRETFIFKIVPMLNPDGVIQGNYRCNLVGVDLNRRWPNPSKILHPTIHYTKKLLRELQATNSISLFCDFHGHSRKRNIFMYGCLSVASDINCHKNNNQIKMFPYMMSQRNKTFSYADCKFANEKDKDSTARMVVFKDIGVMNSYTFESTFYATFNPKTQKKKTHVEGNLQIKAGDLYLVGEDFCYSMVNILNSKIMKKKFVSENSFKLDERPIDSKRQKEDKMVTSGLNQTPLRIIQAKQNKNSSRSQGTRAKIANSLQQENNLVGTGTQLVKCISGAGYSTEATEYGTTSANYKIQRALQAQNQVSSQQKIPQQQQHLMFKPNIQQNFVTSPPKKIKRVINPQNITAPKEGEKIMGHRLTLAQAIAPSSMNDSMNESFFPFVPKKESRQTIHRKANRGIQSSLQTTQLHLESSQTSIAQGSSINRLDLKSSNACQSPAPKMSNPIIAKAIQAQSAGKVQQSSTIQAHSTQQNLFLPTTQKPKQQTKRRKLSKKIESVVSQSKNDLSRQESQPRVSVSTCQVATEKVVYQNKLNLPNLIQILKNNQRSQESSRKLTSQFVIQGDVEYYVSRNGRVSGQNSLQQKMVGGLQSTSFQNGL